MSTAGHRLIPHTADLALEAWAPGKEQCITEAVQALVESFADVPPAAPRHNVTVAVSQASDEELLVGVLNEVIYQLDAHGRIPVDVSIGERPGAAGDRADVRFAAVPADEVTATGAVPKAVSLHELHFRNAGGLWRCQVTVDT